MHLLAQSAELYAADLEAAKKNHERWSQRLQPTRLAGCGLTEFRTYIYARAAGLIIESNTV